jgi:hypothetical protein
LPELVHGADTPFTRLQYPHDFDAPKDPGSVLRAEGAGCAFRRVLESSRDIVVGELAVRTTLQAIERIELIKHRSEVEANVPSERPLAWVRFEGAEFTLERCAEVLDVELIERFVVESLPEDVFRPFCVGFGQGRVPLSISSYQLSRR